MKIKNIVTVLLVVFILVSCVPASKVAPTETAVPTSTFTPIPPTPTATVTITPTPVTFIEGLNNIPMPDSNFIEQVVSENYLKVMGLTHEQVNLVYVERTGINGQKFIAMVDSTTGVPLAIYKSAWQKSTLNFFGEQVGIVMGTDTLENPSQVDIQVTREFERATIQVGNEWFRVEPERGKIDASQALATETLINVLEKAGITDIVGHPIISIYPDWLRNGNFSKDELREIMRQRIEYEMNTHPRINSWVVVNEPYWEGVIQAIGERGRDPFYEAWGNYDYILEAFQIARQVKPNAKLILNNQDNQRPQGATSKSTRSIAEMLHEKGLIDYVGMEMHLNQWGGIVNGKVDTSVIKEIDFYKQMGVPVLITEMTYEPTDIELKMTPEMFNDRLAAIFGKIFEIAIESKNVKGITFWGVTDKYIKDINWYQIFDENGQPKKSYYIVLKTLYESTK